MSILNVNLTDIRGLSKTTQREMFEEWKQKKMPKPKNLSFEGEKQVIAGKERTFVVASFGDYVDASNHKRRFVCYRCGLGTISRVYSWVWDEQHHRWHECAVQGFGSW